MRFRLLLLCCLLCLSPALSAHTLAPALLEIQETGTNNYEVLWRIDQRTRLNLPQWPAGCEAGPATVQRHEQALEHRFRLSCTQSLDGRPLQFEDLGAARSTVLLRYHDTQGQLFRELITANAPAAAIPERLGDGNLALQYFRLGVQHILAGADHLLLVLGLWLLAGSRRQLILLITAFTLGHSLTLALATLGLLKLPAHWVELTIAATLLALALELQTGRTARKPHVAVCIAFGLIHGLGFAGELRRIGLPAGELPTTLLSFNLGIEAGQLLFIGLLSVAARLLTPTGLVARPASSYLIGTLACFWLIDRGLQAWPY